MLRHSAVGIAALALAAVAGCASSSETGAPVAAPAGEANTSSATPAETASGNPTPSASPSGSVSPAFSGVTVAVAVKDGTVSPPPGRVQIKQGQRVRITVTSDIADKIHLHGYDLEVKLPAGKPATLEFTASRAGLFEVETHEAEKQLFQLVVR